MRVEKAEKQRPFQTGGLSSHHVPVCNPATSSDSGPAPCFTVGESEGSAAHISCQPLQIQSGSWSFLPFTVTHVRLSTVWSQVMLSQVGPCCPAGQCHPHRLWCCQMSVSRAMFYPDVAAPVPRFQNESTSRLGEWNISPNVLLAKLSGKTLFFATFGAFIGQDCKGKGGNGLDAGCYP